MGGALGSKISAKEVLTARQRLQGACAWSGHRPSAALLLLGRSNTGRHQVLGRWGEARALSFPSQTPFPALGELNANKCKLWLLIHGF